MRRLILCLLALFTLAGCDEQAMMKAFIPEKEAAEGQRYVEDVRLGRYAEFEDKIDPAYVTPALPGQLKVMTAIFPKGENPRSLKIIGSRTNSLNGAVTYDFSYEYTFTKKAVLATIQLRPAAKHLQIESMNVVPVAQAIEDANAFTFRSKGPVQYIFLFLAIAFPILCIVTAVVCWRSRLARPRWLWMIFVLVGLVSATLNWTTGAFTISPVTFVVLGAAFTKPPYGPLMLQIAIPIGAIVFWIFLPRWRRRARANAADTFGPQSDIRSGPPA